MDNAKFFKDIQSSRSQLFKDFTFEEEHIVILMTTVLNNEVVVLLQNENAVVPLQGTDTIHHEVDPVDKVEPKILNRKCLGDQRGREVSHCK